jgi:tRNA(Ile)-lysidine synthetase-like protein
VLGPARATRLREAALRAQSGRFVELGHGWVAEIAFGRLRLFRRDRETSSGGDGTRVEWGDEDRGTIRWGRWVITWSRQPAGQLMRCSLTTWVVGSGAWVRRPEPGDRLNPLGGVGRRPVSRLLMEGRVPRSERSAFPVVGCGGDIVWLPGICRAESAAPAPGQLAVRLDASVR